MTNILDNYRKKQILSSFKVKEVEKAATEGIYSDTSANRKLGRVGMSYKQYKEKDSGENSQDENRESKEKYSFRDAAAVGYNKKGIIPYVMDAMKKEGKSNKLIETYRNEASNPKNTVDLSKDIINRLNEGKSLKNVFNVSQKNNTPKKVEDEWDEEKAYETFEKDNTIQGVKFKQVGQHGYYRDKDKTITDFKAVGPTGNVIKTNDYNLDLSTSSKEYGIEGRGGISGEYIRLKNEKWKDYYEGKISLEEAYDPYLGKLVKMKQEKKSE